MKIIIDYHPFPGRAPDPWQRGTWPCHWVSCPGVEHTPCITAYRLRFELDKGQTVRLHVTADERYELYLDGEMAGRGPERGEPRRWYFETYDLSLEAGRHVLAAAVWALREMAPVAQFSLGPGFLLCPEEEGLWDVLGTGRAPWEAKPVDGYSFTPPMAAFGVGHRFVLDGAKFPWGFETGAGEGWLPVRKQHPGYCAAARNEVLPHEHLLHPGTLPAMLDEPRQVGRVRHVSAPGLTATHALPIRAADDLADETPGWQALLRGEAPLTLPPHTRRRVIVDLEDYYCAYPELIVTGGEGASIRLHWQESLFADTAAWDKGRRGEVEGKFFTTMWWHQDGLGDIFLPDGGEHRRFTALWWSAGRYLEILVETDNRPLTIEALFCRETRYPLSCESEFSADDGRLAKVIPIAHRALQMCAHETYMDCPYFEQLMYVGDTRLECLVTYATTRDDRLPRKALSLFDLSRLPSGFTQSRYPSRLRQIIPPFSLWWVAMLHDYLMWRGDPAFIRTLLPGARAVLDAFTGLRGGDCLVRSPQGWNYVDWVTSWANGEPPGAAPGEICAPINWQYVYALNLAAQLEEAGGEAELAERCRRLAGETARALTERYWDPARGLFADDRDRTIFTEHSQCLAILSDEAGGWTLLPAAHRRSIADRLFDVSGLTQPTVYFMHYYFEACRALGRMDAFLRRMSFWFDMADYDFKTTYENGDPHTNRSDCHAWGAHPLYHYFASLLGIRPASPGFRTVAIAPQLGSLRHAAGRLVHPAGMVAVEFRLEGEVLRGGVELPPGVAGSLSYGGQSIPLHEGWQQLTAG